jgi:hypothetical protein
MNTVTMRISYETILQLVDQLSLEQRQALAAHLINGNGHLAGNDERADITHENHVAHNSGHTLYERDPEKRRQIHLSNTINLGLIGVWSMRREHWYGDDGR